jgi:hypothetical protein
MSTELQNSCKRGKRGPQHASSAGLRDVFAERDAVWRFRLLCDNEGSNIHRRLLLAHQKPLDQCQGLKRRRPMSLPITPRSPRLPPELTYTRPAWVSSGELLEVP